jgi:hypothetical protein
MPDAKALTVAQHIIKTILKFGIPDQILTDQGKNYQAEMLQHIYDLLDVYKTKTEAYNPQCDGGSEVFIRQFKQMITCFIQQPENQKDWDQKIPFLTYAYNTATHSTTGFSPFELCMGRIENFQQIYSMIQYQLNYQLTIMNTLNNSRTISNKLLN